MSKQTRPIAAFDDRLGFVPLHQLDRAVALLISAYFVGAAAYAFLLDSTPSLYLLLDTIHNYFGRFALFMALFMFAIAVYIGLLRHADVTPYFRRGTYVCVGMMLLQGAIGALMYFGLNIKPGEDVHILYGLGTMLSLPFFIYVERTATKRPAMGSYLWGFGLLAGIIVRCISTGPIGG